MSALLRSFLLLAISLFPLSSLAQEDRDYPEFLGPDSRATLDQIAEQNMSWDLIQILIASGYVHGLASSVGVGAEAASPVGMEEAFTSLGGVEAIQRRRIRDAIDLLLINEHNSLTREERQFWESYRDWSRTSPRDDLARAEAAREGDPAVEDRPAIKKPISKEKKRLSRQDECQSSHSFQSPAYWRCMGDEGMARHAENMIRSNRCAGSSGHGTPAYWRCMGDEGMAEGMARHAENMIRSNRCTGSSGHGTPAYWRCMGDEGMARWAERNRR